MAETKSKQAEVMVAMLNFQSGIYNNAYEELTNEKSFERPGKNSNHINWLLGHILTCRYMLANICGVEDQDPYNKMYFPKLEEANDYKTIEEIKSHWEGISNKLVNVISELTDEELHTEIPNMGTRYDLINFFIYHEAYHLGQIGYARKLAGLRAMKSN